MIGRSDDGQVARAVVVLTVLTGWPAKLKLSSSLWWNWQTRMVSNLLGYGPCGFESRRRHRRKLTSTDGLSYLYGRLETICKKSGLGALRSALCFAGRMSWWGLLEPDAKRAAA